MRIVDVDANVFDESADRQPGGKTRVRAIKTVGNMRTTFHRVSGSRKNLYATVETHIGGIGYPSLVHTNPFILRFYA